MKKITAYLSNYTAPSSGFSEGKLKDDPGDGSGSGITVQTHNDFLYGFIAPIIKWLGAVSETDESETASDMLTAIERAAGIANENVSNWANGTTYAQDAHVMYLGVQYVSMKNSNTGQNPIDAPLYWLPCFGRDEVMRIYRDGHDIPGGFAPLHNVRDATNYREFFQWGKYNFGGAAGRNFQAHGVHLDGHVITGDADYIAIFNVGETNQYPLLDVIAPIVNGVRTLLNTKGRVPRCVDATGGSSVVVGLTQEDQLQGHDHFKVLAPQSTGSGDGTPQSSQSGETVRTTKSGGVTNDLAELYGTARFGSETRMKNYSVGLKSIVVLVEIV
jgi:hypothetical protein